nr:MAG TPA: hypothetical protein [Caudoviricetes sp.]
MKQFQYKETEKNFNEVLEATRNLNEKQKSFIQGYIAGAKDAQPAPAPAPAAKEPEKQEEVKK